MKRITDACDAKEKYRKELMNIKGVRSIHVTLKEQGQCHGHTISYRVIIRIIVKDKKSKANVEKFLAKQPHPGRLDDIPVEIKILS